MSTVYHDFIPLYPGGNTAVTPSTNTATDIAVIAVPYRCQVRRVGVVPTATSAGTSDILFDQRVLAGSDVGRVTFATVSKAGNQQGKFIYEDPASSVILYPGDEIAVKSSAVGNVVAIGALHPVVLVERVPEVPANESDMVASA